MLRRRELEVKISETSYPEAFIAQAVRTLARQPEFRSALQDLREEIALSAVGGNHPHTRNLDNIQFEMYVQLEFARTLEEVVRAFTQEEAK